MPRATARSYDSRRRVRPSPAPRARRVPVRQTPRRVVIAPPTIRVEIAGQAYAADLPERPVHVGRGPDCDLRLASDGVGHDHCLLQPLPDGRHVVKDLSSGHPTRVNGIEVHQVSLREGDVIEVGEARIVFRPPPPPSAPSAQAPAAQSPGGPAAGVEAAPPRAPRRPAPPGGHRLAGPLLGLGAAAVVAVAVALVLGSGGEEGRRAAAKRRLDRGLDLYRAQQYTAAREALLELATDRDAGTIGRKARRYVERTETAIEDAKDELKYYADNPTQVDLASVKGLRERFLERHGPTFAEELDAVLARVGTVQRNWREDRLSAARNEAAPHLRSSDFASARGPWVALLNGPPVGLDLGEAATEALAAIDRAAEGDATTLLTRAEALVGDPGPSAAAEAVRGGLTRFLGTPQHARLSAAVERYDQAARDLAAAATPVPETPTTTPDVTTPDVGAEEAAAVALASADEAASRWAFADAVAALADVGLDKLPDVVRGRVQGRKDDLEQAQKGLELLIADIGANPDRYKRVKVSPRTTVTLLRADPKGVAAAVRGGETRYKWATLHPTGVTAIAKRAKATGPDALALAALLREAEQLAETDRLLIAAEAGGVEAGALHARVARWRGEAVPAGGYVAHDGHYVSPADRDRLVLQARVDEAVVQVRHRDAKVWKAAAEELLSLGPVARPALFEALTARRDDVVGALSELSVFTSNRTKKRLFDELETRRAHALSLVRDERRWPYPNPSGQSTDEVVARVDAVREIWERPFDVIVAGSKDANEKLLLLSEVDEYLVRADSSFSPSLDAVREKVNRAVDMPAFTPSSSSRSTREYSLKALAYNEKVPTTATREEKDCVLAVNEYRMMMGHVAVKINERLVRAARGHSHHMRENNYFAHDVPAANGPNDANRTPGHRARAQGYGGGVGENIARGTQTGRAAFHAWFKSSGHHRNMIGPRWTEMGAGRSGGNWWTQLFGAKRGKSLDLPDALPDPDPFFAPEPEDDQGRPVQPGTPELPDEPPPMPPDGPDDGQPGDGLPR